MSDDVTIEYSPAFKATTQMISSGRLPNVTFSRPPIESPV